MAGRGEWEWRGVHWDVEGKALWRWSSGGRASCGCLGAVEVEVRGREELEERRDLGDGGIGILEKKFAKRAAEVESLKDRVGVAASVKKVRSVWRTSRGWR